MDECNICCEKYNKSNHKQVDCGFCDLSCCRTCVQHYLLSTTQDAHCLQCKHAWNRDFIDKNCTKSFRNGEYKTQREVILFEKEKCLLPQTQHLVVQERARRETTRMAREIRDNIARQREELHRLDVMLYTSNFNIVTEKKKFVRKCPHEGCKGFLSSVWKCDVCENWTCPHCNEVKGKDKDADHACDPNNVDTVNLLKKDTKPCPSCGTMIFKISGCSQMWCPDCHTAFDWRSGAIETGMVHNPHFYEFQMRTGHTGRVAGDIPCGGLPSLVELREYFGMEPYQDGAWRRREIVPEHIWYIWKIHRLISHIDNYELAYNYVAHPVDNADLRVKYLMNELDEPVFKKLIQRREKAYAKTHAMRDMLQMFVNAASDILRQMIVNNDDVKYIENIIRELVDYCNASFITMAKQYTHKPKQFVCVDTSNEFLFV